jgi:hypothetical protein
MRWMAAAVLGVVCSGGLAQQVAMPPATPETTGTIVGHVYLADTGGPARLAQVALQSAQVPSDDAKKSDTHQTGSFQIYRTALDGGYRITHVRPGSYYVVVKMPGYLSPFAMFTNQQLSHPTPDDQQKIDAYLPVVLVVPNNSATMDIHLTRGASLSGTLSFDDGEPYPDVRVQVMQKDAKGKWQTLPLVSGGYTDDLGNFRITGLLAGEYLLRASFSLDDMFVSSVLEQPDGISSFTHFSLDYYSGDTVRLRDAKPIHVDSSQEVSGANITIPVSKLHMVSGQIVQAGGGRAINGGIVVLCYSDGDGEELASVKVESDEPVFRMPFVPEGSYVIKVKDAEDVRREEISNGPGSVPPFHIKETVIQNYGTTEQPLVVTGDVSGVNLAVAAAAKAP